MHFIGLTRFSVVSEASLGSFRSTRDGGYDQAVAAILSEDRLAHRFSLFEAFALPSIAALMASEPSYRHVIAVSDRLPSHHATRLRTLVSSLPHVQVLSVGRRDDMRDLFRAAADLGSSPVFTFRLDDDDALSRSYFSMIREALTGMDGEVAVSIDDGYHLERRAHGYRLAPKNSPLIALGLGLLSRSRTIFDAGKHTDLNVRYEVRHVRGHAGWVRVKHEHSDVRRRWYRSQWWRPSISAAHVRERLGPAFAHVKLG